MVTKTTTLDTLIREIHSFNNAVVTDRLEHEIGHIIKFDATKFAGEGISLLFAEKYGIRVLKWRGSNEYFFILKINRK